MIIRRSSQSGITLIEMLAALAISGLIGLAGFALLESVVQTEEGLAGHVDQLTLQDRAFQLLARDLSAAGVVETATQGRIILRYPVHTISWQGSAKGLERHITFATGPALTQQILTAPVNMGISPGPVPLLRIELLDGEIDRVFHLPRTRQP